MWYIKLLFISLPIFNQSLSVKEQDKNIDTLKINQVQILGSHNSYRIKTHQPIWDYLNKLRHPVAKAFITKAWDYSHPQPLDSQLNMGLRTLELDIYHDPTGGRFYSRLGNKLINESPESGIEDLKKPGLKVMHAPDFDYNTLHYLFSDALRTIKNWSDKNPNHLPLYIMVEAKDLHFMKFLFPRHCTKVLKFTKAAVDSIDLEIESVFGKNSKQIITPDIVRGDFPTLNIAVQKDNWPSLKEARGKIIFIMMSSPDAKKAYLDKHESLKGRKMFVYAKENDPEAAFIKIEKPAKNMMLIKRLVKKGYMIKTRSDSPTKDARKGDYKNCKAAFETGAQIIGTDYFVPDKRYLNSKKWTDYQVGFPNNLNYQISPILVMDTIKH